jgi:hypothetical protein
LLRLLVKKMCLVLRHQNFTLGGQKGLHLKHMQVLDADSRVLDPIIDSRMGMLSSSNVASIPAAAINYTIFIRLKF